MLTRFSLAPLFSWNSDPLINISPQAQGTASQLPYDVLRVIFFHCLPPYPLDDLQPNTKIAPILLCHACSSWRMAALSVPELWSHLHFNFRISDVIVEDRAFESNFILAPRNHWQNEFLSWWRNNQGYKPTFTHFGPAWVGLGGRSDDVSVTKMDILNDYLTSAQYLKLEYPFFTLMAQMFRSKGELKVPNLNTLVKSGWNEFDSDSEAFFSLMSNLPRSALQRFSMTGSLHPDLSDGYHPLEPEDFVVPHYWQTLTHMSLTNFNISIGDWVKLISGLPNLRWGNFEFKYFDTDVDDVGDYHPKHHTHLHLRTLLLTVHHVPHYVESPLMFLSEGFDFPSLETLFLSSNMSTSWLDSRAINELYTVLASTPSITTLSLGERFLSFASPDSNWKLVGHISPIWSHVPHLNHLEQDSTKSTT